MSWCGQATNPRSHANFQVFIVSHVFKSLIEGFRSWEYRIRYQIDLLYILNCSNPQNDIFQQHFEKKSPRELKITFWYCRTLDLDESFHNLPKLLIYKTILLFWRQNNWKIEFRSQCHILSSLLLFCFTLLWWFTIRFTIIVHNPIYNYKLQSDFQIII